MRSQLTAPSVADGASLIRPALQSQRYESIHGNAVPARLSITAVGRDGDGIARPESGEPIYVPLALPGETVEVDIAGARGSLVAILAASPDRVVPPCPHFGVCGGCALQHWSLPAYRAWKRALLIGALSGAGYSDIPIAATEETPPHARRRIDLAVQRRGPVVVLGLHRARDKQAIDIDGCVVLHPLLEALLAPLREALRRLPALKREGAAVLNLLDSGIDVLLRLDGTLSLADRTALIGFARAHDLPRLSVAADRGESETIALLRPPEQRFGGVVVRPPPGAFLQASRAGEAAIVGAVLAGLPEVLPRRVRIADLYAGCGTLTLPLAGRAMVAAFEGDAGSVASLRAGVNAVGLGSRVTVEQRDLVRRPIMAKDLAAFSLVVLDPPHAGAAGQVQQLAASSVKRVIYVSCNPDTLARDAAVLRAAGFAVVAATPIDQFPWSARLESVTILVR